MTTIEQQTETALDAVNYVIRLMTDQAYMLTRLAFDIAQVENEARMIDMYEDFGVPYVKLQ